MVNGNTNLTEHITKEVVKELYKRGVNIEKNRYLCVPVEVSARHLHLSRKDARKLFGDGYIFTKFKDISQTGQFATNEKVTLTGPKGKIENVRVLAPERAETQIEVSVADSRRLGINPPVRSSGNLKGTPGICLTGPAGTITLSEGCILADRHIHMTPQDAQNYGVRDGQKVMVRADGAKGGVMDNVYIRVREDFVLNMHIDTDDANAFLLKDGDLVEILK